MRDPDPASATIARIREAMERYGMTQVRLAARLGWPQQRLSRRLTTGPTAVALTVGELCELAVALGIEPDELLRPTGGVAA